MATGGTIPSNREQSIIFYNTTGVIEKDKNIYFCPRFSQAGGTVKSKYLDKFNVVCPPSSVYTDIDVSSWSPQDRILRIKGNVDDFRTVTDEGTCLNYFIITRKVTKNDNVYTYYYAFFITGVSQEGGSSIRLTVVPDDFTNVFYLHNNDTVTVGYEPFNSRLKNCYVKRQHYARFQDSHERILNVTFTTPQISDMLVGQTLQLYINGQYISNYTILSYAYLGNAYKFELGYTDDSFDTSIFDNFSSCYFYYHGSQKDVSAVSNVSLVPHGIIASANKVFFSQEELFKYKYQYRDMKYPISPYSASVIFTSEERELIKSATSYSQLSSTLRKKVSLACLQFLAIQLKSDDMLMPISHNITDTNKYGSVKSIGGASLGYFNESLPTIYYPILIIPKEFTHLNLTIALRTLISDSTFSAELTTGIAGRANNVINKYLSTKNYADYIYSAYIVPLLPIKDFISYDEVSGNPRITFNSELQSSPAIYDPSVTGRILYKNYESNKLYYQALLLNSGNINNNWDSYAEVDIYNNSLRVTKSGSNVSLSGDTYGGFVLSSGSNLQMKFDKENSLSEDTLINDYFDPVLESEPYSFYSLSYINGYELPFNKARYYTEAEFDFKVNFYISVNNGVKIGAFPIYTVEGVSTEYFNEGLLITLQNSLTLVSDSYSSFYYQNMAQMKNQFAVADKQFENDLLQSIFVTSPNKVGYSAGKGGISGGGAGAGANALLETGNQVMGWIDDYIDMRQTKEITEMNQKSKLADIGRKPDVVKQLGTDVYFDYRTQQAQLYFNHYTIDELSYNSIAKLYERIGYQVNLYSELNTMDRVGWNFIQLNTFDFNPEFEIMTEQESSIRALLSEGVTLLHDKSYLTSGHNYETILDE